MMVEPGTGPLGPGGNCGSGGHVDQYCFSHIIDYRCYCILIGPVFPLVPCSLVCGIIKWAAERIVLCLSGGAAHVLRASRARDVS